MQFFSHFFHVSTCKMTPRDVKLNKSTRKTTPLCTEITDNTKTYSASASLSCNQHGSHYALVQMLEQKHLHLTELTV